MDRLNPRDFLQPGEEVLREDRRHPVSVVADVVVTFLLAAAADVGLVVAFRVSFGDSWLDYAWPFLLIPPTLWAIYLLARILRVITSRYLITTDHVYFSHGALRFSLLQSTYDKVTDLHVRQGILGRVFGYGTVRLDTAGASVPIAGVADPFGVKQEVETARRRFIALLVEDFKQRRGTQLRAGTAQPAALRPVQLVWEGRPSFESMIGSFVGIGLGALVAGLFFFSGLALGEGALFLPSILFVVIAALTLAGVFIRYKYTRFEVTTHGLVVNSGWLGRSRVETTFDKVTDVTTNQSLLGRLLNYGQIQVNTAGGVGAPIVFHGVQDPLGVKAIIESARLRPSSSGAGA